LFYCLIGRRRPHSYDDHDDRDANSDIDRERCAKTQGKADSEKERFHRRGPLPNGPLPAGPTVLPVTVPSGL
jgi:hypothetical protein